MRSIAVVFLSFAALALAYQVTTPSSRKGWTDSGAQTLSWERVDTDPLNFTVILTNENRDVMPINNQVLSAQVDGKLLTTTLNPPSAGWPVGEHFRINLVKSPEETDAILAQSSEFDILPPDETTTSRTTTGSVKPTSTGTTPTTHNTAPSSSNGTNDANPTDDSSAPNGAIAAMSVQSGFLSVCALLGFFLA